MLESLQNFIVSLLGADDLSKSILSFYSNLSPFNQMLLMYLTIFLTFVGAFQIFKSILKLASNVIKLVLFIFVIYIIGSIIFNF